MYLEGMEEASIFVHVAVSDISGKVSATCGASCLSNPWPLPSHVAGVWGLAVTLWGLFLLPQGGQWGPPDPCVPWLLQMPPRPPPP